MRQDQFLEVIGREEAWRRFQAHLRLTPLEPEQVPLAGALDRVLAEEAIATIDVPGFDRSNVDGFAVRAADTFGATEASPRDVAINAEALAPGRSPGVDLPPGTATLVATGAMVPRGADAVVMVEFTDVVGDGAWPQLKIVRPVSPGENITFAGTDIARGETVLRVGTLITSREIGVLAALGRIQVSVIRKPRVAILSTGDEVIAPGVPLPQGCVYDSNAAILASAVAELGGEPELLGIVRDDETPLSELVNRGLDADLLVLSGGTSKGEGDLSYRVVRRLGPPGVVAHGVALKPGKPICLAVHNGKPVVVLPGFPTSAVFTFHEFVAPVIRALAGRPDPAAQRVEATLPMRLNSERGRTEYVLVGLVRADGGLAAYPMGKGSGSVTTFSTADGFITIDQHTEQLQAGTPVDVQLLGSGLRVADLVVIGSHCVGLDFLLSQVQRRGLTVKSLNVGSQGGLAAAERGQCDLAGIHLLDPESGQYNRPFVTPDLLLIPGYRRLQGLVHRPGDPRFEGRTAVESIDAACADARCLMVNRNTGSGTRILIDRLLAGRQPPGYGVQVKSHNAVAAAVSQGRADWGPAIQSVATLYGLAFLPLQDEHYDFVAPKSRAARPAVRLFLELLASESARTALERLGFQSE